MAGSMSVEPKMAEDFCRTASPALGRQCSLGDFYATRSNHARGCSVATLAAQAKLLPSGSANSEGCLKGSSEGALDGQDSTRKAMPRFDAVDRPPQIPSDHCDRLEFTRFDVSTDAPWALGNELLGFFETQIAGSILKVSKGKFTLKVCVLTGSATCTLKVRIYSRTPGIVLVEFQRRCGAATTFSRAFREAVRFLQQHFDVSETIRMREKELVYPPCENQHADQSEAGGSLVPLLGMAWEADCRGGRLQAEAAAGLAGMAQDRRSATHLLNANAFPAALKELLRINHLEVELPTVQLLASLADLPEAQDFLSGKDEIIQLLKEKGDCKRLNVPVQRQLRHVLDVVERLPNHMPWDQLSPSVVAAC